MNIFFYRHILQEWHMKSDPDCMRVLMFRFWNTALFLIALSALVSMIFVAWTLVAPVHEEAPLAPDVRGDSVETISREQLKNVLTLFEQRDLKHQKLGSKPSPLADPSK